jgi:hypothetical protein
MAPSPSSSPVQGEEKESLRRPRLRTEREIRKTTANQYLLSQINLFWTAMGKSGLRSEQFGKSPPTPSFSKRGNESSDLK